MNQSPCMTCRRVKCPGNCENKQCQVWQRWFLHRSEQIRKLYANHAEGVEQK